MCHERPKPGQCQVFIATLHFQARYVYFATGFDVFWYRVIVLIVLFNMESYLFSGVLAWAVLRCGVNQNVYGTFLEQNLFPRLEPPSVLHARVAYGIMMDNASFHKTHVRCGILKHSASFSYLNFCFISYFLFVLFCSGRGELNHQLRSYPTISTSL